jgi:hypothetical protein
VDVFIAIGRNVKDPSALGGFYVMSENVWREFKIELRETVFKYGTPVFEAMSAVGVIPDTQETEQSYALVVSGIPEFYTGNDDPYVSLQIGLSKLAAKYHQESIAWLVGNTQFIKARS